MNVSHFSRHIHNRLRLASALWSLIRLHSRKLLLQLLLLPRAVQGTVGLHIVNKTLQLGPAHRAINPLGP